MFLATLSGQGSQDQFDLFLDDALNYRLIGCYAQHVSFT
jgi:hypothetical protein